MSEEVSGYYPNALCFEDTSMISLYSNWFDSKYRNIFIAIEACKNYPGKKTECATEGEIQNFIKSNTFYIISQRTAVNKDIYDHNADKHYETENGYWPLDKSFISLFYSNLPEANDGIVPIMELMIGQDMIDITDDYI